jgi:hypothetical protein
MNRRRFLQQTSAAASLLGFPAITRSASPNSFLQVASVGVARMGGNTMRSVATHDKVKITALCDVDDVHMASAVKDFPDAAKHKDWRELIAKHGDKFDAVTIGIPDHMHAAVAATALRAKKHVYLQKPMATTIHECRVLAAEAAKAGVVTQLGNQGRSTVEGRMMVELLRTGADALAVLPRSAAGTAQLAPGAMINLGMTALLATAFALSLLAVRPQPQTTTQG